MLQLTAGGRQRRPGESGQSLAEFALVFTPLAMVLFGIIQFGFTLGGQQAVVNAVRDSARYAATRQMSNTSGVAAHRAATDLQLRNNLQRSVPGYRTANLTGTAATRVTYCAYPNPGGTTYSIRIHVEAAYRHPLFVPIVGNIVDGFDGSNDNALRTLVAEEMRIENPPLSTNGGFTACPSP